MDVDPEGSSRRSKGSGRATRPTRSSSRPLDDAGGRQVGICNWNQHLRFALQSSDFYNSACAWRIRFVLQSRAGILIMQAALIAALLLPELSKLLDLTSNVWTDLAMSIGMALFILELIALSVTDAHYLLSFFHFMDMIGTASMIFDISFLLGSKASEPRMSDRDSAESRVLLLRASRAARVGARAGRLTRVLRVCRCFLDFGDIDEPAKRPPTKKAGFDSLREEDQPAGKKSIAKVISVRLSNLLATRVASLTIFLVMVMPLFDVMSFPQKDLALDAWVDQVSHVNQMDEKLTISELQKMAEFFSHHRHGLSMCHERLCAPMQLLQD
ncbi:unnamed protein product [Effrenium voratum]|nr:unnamed protein product [Effrenium voratum]